MPVHEGHVALIKFAADHCDELIVSMSYAKTDPIDHRLRMEWLREIFDNVPTIRIFEVEDDFDPVHLPLNERTKVWSDFIKRTYPRIDILFSSESYGDPFAAHLGAIHMLFDEKRFHIPVSATLIRREPLKYWQYIPLPVRPYFVKKICFYGPESTGKSTMAKRMAEKYNTVFVPEVARELLTSNDFSIDDIIRIGYAQAERVIENLKVANRFLFCDTDAITTQIYSAYYLQQVPPVLHELEKQIIYDHYFLFDIDVPWMADGLRDLGEKREEMFKLFREELEKRNIAYTIVQGKWAQREKIIDDVLLKLLA
jgi:HTH-type transcriptional repressor of NAD biosynthesis genes